MRLPSRSVILARRLEAALALTPLGAASRGLGDRARASFERRHPELGGAVAEATINGVRLRAPGELWQAFVERGFDAVSSARLRSFLRPGMTVVDVGAHLGYYTLLAARKVGQRGCVHAFEPCPVNLTLLRQNVDRYAAGNVIVHAVAAGQETATRSFRLAGSGDTAGFYEHPLAATTGVVSVEQVRVDDLVSPPVDLVKVDVEGAEMEVLAGMSVLVGSGPGPALLLEWNPACLRAAGRDPRDLLEWLKDNGYRFEAIDEERGTVVPVEALLRRLRNGELPTHWFCNLWARRPAGSASRSDLANRRATP
jgi:FkbM family methyltransferase